jgi:hypothetical protein
MVAHYCRLTRQFDDDGDLLPLCLIEQTDDDLKNALPEGYVLPKPIVKIQKNNCGDFDETLFQC